VRVLMETLTAQVYKITGVAIPPDIWNPVAVPEHPQMCLRVNTEGRGVAAR